ELGKRLNTAVDSPVPNDARYSFLIALDPVQTPDKACQVGKPGQVSFQTDSLQDRAVRSIAGLANNDFGAFFGKLANASMATVDRVKEVVTRLGS
ncbi:hypothetical protein, partial [Rhizobium sp.]|uniref:hypothetical protein n=1 Tax=Rhizobium sp. TaxID=391 RepID=UPI003F80E985